MKPFPYARHLLFIALILWMIPQTGWSLPALPETPGDCPAAFPAALPATRALRQQEAGRLAPLGDACQTRADYFAYHGALLISLGRLQEAAVALEKALMIDPELAGAQLDYAQALAELGELDSARSLAREVVKRPDIPAALQTWLTDQLDQWQGKGWRLSGALELTPGHETNLNSAPGLKTLTLTLPSGNVPIELDASEHRVAGAALRADLTGVALHTLGAGVVQFTGEYLARNSHASPDTDQNLLNLTAAYVHPLLGGQLGGRIEQTQLRLHNKPTYASDGWNLTYQLPPAYAPGGCATSLGAAADKRRFPQAGYQNGHYRGTQAGLSCRTAEWQTLASLHHGHDNANDPIRLGGNQIRDILQLGIARKTGPITWAFYTQQTRLNDEKPYSPLLGNIPRRIDRKTWQLSCEYFLDTRWSWIGRLENTRQSANIELFQLQNRTLYLGLKIQLGH